MQKYYDREKNRLVFIKEKASHQFWDKHWGKYNIKNYITSGFSNRFILRLTKKYLKSGSKILEGGCGLGQNVYFLGTNNYEAYGIDYAVNTINQIHNVMPDLKVLVGDVRSLPFENNFFDGYWSLGVIEHFYEGFDQVAREMARVVKPKGYMYITFPCLSEYRKIKIKQKMYPNWKQSMADIDKFYQFAFSADYVKQIFCGLGFNVIASKPIGGFKGFKDEIEIFALQKILQNIYDSSFFPARVLVFCLDYLFNPFAGHCQLLVFQNSKTS